MTAEEVLRAYKRQPLIEERFSQFKSDFDVASVYLGEVTRIQAQLAIIFFVLMLLQTLLECELRQALASSECESLPLYPEHRACTAPTTRRNIDIFETAGRHQLSGGGESQTFVTQLTPLELGLARFPTRISTRVYIQKFKRWPGR